jgi:hypothetical protein
MASKRRRHDELLVLLRPVDPEIEWQGNFRKDTEVWLEVCTVLDINPSQEGIFSAIEETGIFYCFPKSDQCRKSLPMLNLTGCLHP